MFNLIVDSAYFSFYDNNKVSKSKFELDSNFFCLKNISFEVKEGEFIGILGPNGSGKTTLMKLIAGILSPQKGKILLNNKNLKEYKAKELARIISYTPQRPFSVFPFSVYEIVLMGRYPYMNFLGYETEEDRKIVLEILDVMEISNVKNKSINEISGGEAQRAFIGRALAQNPKLLILDESNSHLDIKHQLQIFDLIEKLNKEKKIAVIAVLHDLNLAGHYAKRIIFLKDGKIIIDQNARDALTQKNIYDIFGVDSYVYFDKAFNKTYVTIKPFPLCKA